MHDETRYYISSAALDAQKAHQAVRGHWAIENSLHWVLDVGFAEDQSRLRKGFGAKNMAVVRHFALNLVRRPRTRNPSSCAGKSPDGRPAISTASSMHSWANWIRGPGAQPGARTAAQPGGGATGGSPAAPGPAWSPPDRPARPPGAGEQLQVWAWAARLDDAEHLVRLAAVLALAGRQEIHLPAPRRQGTRVAAAHAEQQDSVTLRK